MSHTHVCHIGCQEQQQEDRDTEQGIKTLLNTSGQPRPWVDLKAQSVEIADEAQSFFPGSLGELFLGDTMSVVVSFVHFSWPRLFIPLTSRTMMVQVGSRFFHKSPTTI